MEHKIILSGQLKEFADRRAKILLEKNIAIKSQQYEKAAFTRDMERKLENEVIDFLKKDAKYDLTDIEQKLKDIWMLFDLVKPGETTFENALKRITVPNLQRMHLINKIEEYKNNKITLDAIHREIKNSFELIISDLKEKISKLD